MLLAIDTSTSAVTVALHGDGRTVAESTTLDARRHGELAAPAVARVLAEAGVAAQQVGAVVAGVGPGPFTGLRVGLVTARVFAFARSVPVYGVCSLDALAHQVWLAGRGDAPPRLVVATDARRKEVYWATYQLTADGALREDGPRVDRPGELPETVRSLPTAGRGPVLYPEQLGPACGPLDCSAAALADLAGRALRARAASTPGADPDDGRLAGVLTDPEPLYLRRPDAAPPPTRKPVLT